MARRDRKVLPRHRRHEVFVYRYSGVGTVADIKSALEGAREAAHKRSSQIDDWLGSNEEKKEELLDALRWYSENSTHRFGWRIFYQTLKKQPGWEDLPGNYQCLAPWAKDNLPEIF